MYLGWTQVAFDCDLTEDVVPIDCDGHALIAVRGGSTFVVYEGRCPHRGAHLGYGGRVYGSSLVCPFHGHRIHLGASASGCFAVGAYRTIRTAGGLFVLLDDAFDTGLAERLLGLSESHHVKPAFERRLRVPPEYVIENVFDADHFVNVHALKSRPNLEFSQKLDGSIHIEGQFDAVHPSTTLDGTNTFWSVAARLRFSADVFSPNVVVAELGPAESPNVVITAATATGGGCLARVTVALPRGGNGRAPTVGELSSLIEGSRTAFDQDQVVWDHLDTTMRPRYVETDTLVRQYRQFCERFRESTGTP